MNVTQHRGEGRVVERERERVGGMNVTQHRGEGRVVERERERVGEDEMGHQAT